jgi:hypothetical protein
MTTNQVTVFNAEAASVVFTTKKGDVLTISAEGAMFKGGAALAALKDVAIDSAFAKAVGGRYTAAADIIGTAYPSVMKACIKLLGSADKNKQTMAALLGGVEMMEEPAKGWSDKQLKARSLLKALRNIPALAVNPTMQETIDAISQ